MQQEEHPDYHQNTQSSIIKQSHQNNMENELQALQGYPQHLSKVNYLSVESFSNSLQDQALYKVFHHSIVENRYLFEGKTVLHITQGMNMLYSFFAVEAGCKKVLCVINGDSERQLQNIYMMRQIIKQNKHEDMIEVMSWKNLNHEVDVIIGQPMGYCMHFDGMIDRIIEARDLFLTKKGIILPNILSFKCAVVHDEHFYDYKVQFWNDVYGIPMKSMKKWISHQPIIRVMDPELIVSKVAKLLTFDLQKVSYEQIIKIDRIFQLELLNKTKANGLTFWFQAQFSHGIQKKQIKASPWVQSTKYTQVTLYWPTVEEFRGGSVRIRVKGQKFPLKGYSIISTEVDYKKYQYSFS